MATEKNILKVAKGTDEFLDSSIRHHRRRLLDSIKTLENNIIDMANEFKSSNGSLMGPRVNMKQAQKIHSKLTSLFDETYGAEARQVVKGFTKSANYIKRNFKDLDVTMGFTSVDKDMIKALKNNTWNSFNQFGLQTQEKLADVMYNSIAGKQPFSQMVNHFRGILSGFEDVRGRSMANYADLYAHDSIMDFHNTVNLKKADDLGFKYFLYYGSAMTTTRDFCFRRIGKVFSREEIESWVHSWSGKSGPAMTNRGGYRCRHHWRPVRKDWIKDEGKFEAILRGEQGLPAVLAVPSDALPAEIRAKMSPRQLRAYDSYVPSDLKSRMIAETAERKIAKSLNADHIIGKRPFDLFLDNEFIECKTFVSGRGQIRIRPSSMRKKKAFMKKYNVRGHIVAKDMRKGSPTYGKLFHRAQLGDWTPSTMTEVKDYDHLKQLLKKGSRKYTPSELAFRKVPKSKTLRQAEEYAVKQLGIGEVSYSGVGKVPSDLLNGYMRGAIDNLGVKPTRVLFDDYLFVGRNKNVAALAMEDGTLYLNSKYLGTVEKMKKAAKAQFEFGHFTTDSVGHVINHEFGHLKYFHLGGTEASAGKKLTKQMIGSLKDIGPENLSRYVSKYALKNQGEFFAEMIAKELNGEMLHPVCRKIMSDIERGIRRKGIQRVRKAVKDRGLAAKMRASRFGGGTIGEANVLGELSVKSKKVVKGFLDSIDDLLSKNKFAAIDETEFAGVADALGLEYRTFRATDAGKIKKGYVLGNKEFVSKRGWLKELQKVVKQADLEDVKVVKKVEKIKKVKEKVVGRGREALQKRYDEIKEQYLKAREAGKWETASGLRDALMEAEINVARTFSQEELIEAKVKKIVDNMVDLDEGVKMTRAMEKKIEHIAEWAPYDLIADIERRGGRIHIQKAYRRAGYSTSEFTCHLYKGDTGVTFSHEFSHMVDAHLNASMETGFDWMEGKFATRQEGRNLRSWFHSHHSKKKRQYTNGDGFFWEDNWISDYEGRIYGRGTGQEWWAMNCQRYAHYRKNLRVGYPQHLKQLEKGVEYCEDRLQEYRISLASWKKNKKEIKAVVTRRVKDLEHRVDLSIARLRDAERSLAKATSEGADAWAVRTSQWDTARRKYPDLSKFIEKKFGQGFIVPAEETIISAKAEKVLGKKAIKGRGLAAEVTEREAKKKVVKEAVEKAVEKVPKKVIVNKGSFDELKGMLTRISLMSDPTSIQFEGSDKQGIEVVKKALRYWMKFNLTRKIGLLGAKAKGKIFAVQNKLARKLGDAPSRVELERYFDELKVAVDSEIVEVEAGKYVTKKHMDKVLDSIDMLIGTGGPAANELIKKANIDEDIINFLKQTVKKDKVKLYRGLQFAGIKAKKLLTKEQREILSSLKVGDDVPDFLAKGNVFNEYASYTKKKSVASHYGKGGKLGIIWESEVTPDNILVDLENLKEALKKANFKHKSFNEETFDYFAKDKEVLVIEPDRIKGKVIYIKGDVR